jgi:hypothetical protein
MAEPFRRALLALGLRRPFWALPSHASERARRRSFTGAQIMGIKIGIGRCGDLPTPTKSGKAAIARSTGSRARSVKPGQKICQSSDGHGLLACVTRRDARDQVKRGVTMTNEAYLPQFLQPKKIDSLVRIGRANDGGYIVDNRSVENTDILIGLGINDDWSFEEDFYSRRRVPVIAFDGSVSKSILIRRFIKALAQVHKPRKALSRFRLIHEYSKFFSDDRRHEEKFVGFSNQPGYTSLSAIVEQAKHEKRSKIFFKIDIESAEYRLLDELIENASLITGLVIESHDIDLHIEKLRDFVSRFPLTLVHTHCNNFVIRGDKGVPLCP